MRESRQLLVKLLRTVGFEVREAADGKQGLALFYSWQPDLIWMDIRMPVMDGYEAIKQIKKTKAGKKTIIIILTSSVFEDERQEVLQIGGADLLRKPYLEEEIFMAMERHLGVQFIYEEHTAADTDVRPPKKFAQLPKDIRIDLLEVIGQLDQEGCFKILDKLDVIHHEIASALRILVENYKFEELEDMLKQAELGDEE